MDLFTVDTTGETEFSHQSSKSDKSKAKYFKTVKNSMATMKIKTEGESLEIDYGGKLFVLATKICQRLIKNIDDYKSQIFRTRHTTSLCLR